MVASRSARERKAAAQGGPLARVKIDLDGEQQFVYKISCATCRAQGPPGVVDVPRRGATTASWPRWTAGPSTSSRSTPTSEAPCLAFLAEAQQRLHERREGPA